jgi:hypothetical protein
MGYKKSTLVFGIFFAVLALILNISALTISSINPLYNLGDEISADIRLDSLKEGYLDINLACSDQNINLYHNVADSKTITLKRQLTPVYIGNLSGNCQIQAIYGDEYASSSSFQISNQIILEPAISEAIVEAGKSLLIKGTAYKPNNQLVGQIQNAYIQGNLNENYSLTDSIKDSQFGLNFNILPTTHAGIYTLVLKAYDKDEQGNILNSGETSIRVTVIQKPARISVAIDKVSINPQENLTIMPFIYDFAGDQMKDSVTLKVYDSDSNKIFESGATSDEPLTFSIDSNISAGYATVVVEKFNLSSEKTFYISELKKIDAKIQDRKIIIRNVGNIAYIGRVQIKIGEEIFVEDLNLDYGQTKSFDISAPDGNYDIMVDDGNPLLSMNGVALTGNSINIRATGERISDLFVKYPGLWIFLGAILILFLGIVYLKHRQKQRLSFGMPQRNKTQYMEIKRKGGFEVINPQKVMDRIIAGEEVRKAEQLTVLHGSKSQASIVAIKVKNDLNGIAENSLKEALEYAYSKKAVSYDSGNSIVLIFSPLITKVRDNAQTAIQVALDIDNSLREHNRKFRNDKINYGIGVNTGEIINKLNGKVLQFANINKTISLAKRVADLANGEVLLSKEAHEKTAQVVKAEKFANGSLELFSIKRVVDTEKSQKFINEFMKRNSQK